MSASLIFDIAPIGSIIAWSDGSTQPPERHKKKLSAWKTRNSQGRLVRKQPGRTTGSYVALPDFTIHENDFGSAGTIVLRVFQTFSIDSDLAFKVVERPAPGSVRVFDRPGGQLVHLAASHADAEGWLKQHGYPDAVLDQVAAGEGRAAA
ncbi:hypothetical protein [Rhizobium leguminosarum]|uniref:hypothetical protein n=1 Tax=Rhizobium leguminosarum TaxID=384 RepID=UPI001C98C8DA|nr:hypothetical protein [Rhizobium leguminosarum]MBY5827405.1 hypothetical protein [Rhizobium leguminosarum]